MAGIAEITTVSENNTIMGGISKKDNADASRSQLSPPLVLVNTPELYRIKKIV
jgi:hypothetical protein